MIQNLSSTDTFEEICVRVTNDLYVYFIYFIHFFQIIDFDMSVSVLWFRCPCFIVQNYKSPFQEERKLDKLNQELLIIINKKNALLNSYLHCNWVKAVMHGILYKI